MIFTFFLRRTPLDTEESNQKLVIGESSPELQDDTSTPQLHKSMLQVQNNKSTSELDDESCLQLSEKASFVITHEGFCKGAFLGFFLNKKCNFTFCVSLKYVNSCKKIKKKVF